MRLHWPLINIALLFIAPLLAAFILLQHYPQLNNAAHGKFLQPALRLTLNADEYLAGSNFTQKWSLVYVTPEICDNVCVEQKHILQKLHVALGPQRDRVAIVASSRTALNELVSTPSILIKEPKGTYIMQYTGQIDHLGLLKDLRRLLKYSHV